MGQPIVWEYAVVWRPDARTPNVTLYRRSSAGHLFEWARVDAEKLEGTPSVDTVLQGLYTALLSLMEATA